MPHWSDADGDDEDNEDDEEPTVPCPHCRRPVPEDVPRCPYCDNYLSGDDAPPTRKPWWILLGAAAALYVMYRWVING